ncbi:MULTISPECIES: hypothetical protein [Streptomyces]|uniref:Uncharacterized protein n=1 Tax=Streptomyces venezuelae (strain ATCC 10712 / CBS 650.69 / DSM 40230 / JCM 4526 / NBRC 13096 / PD 04745) TaxID=953739 RepID=F2RJQ6_STRVP|nr:hypothetical protein [Streptomyces venezuelae]APE23334.1 hypothetical protein vnz_21515 [Streptomyces venezuelae]QES00712.1 hypothetical protein DEJ43_21830 [Streptomyces venezuelae ATCC 10712]CCA57640.1 hypothetical protein SVEN_4354 [Streptomyces venezuelae ATCC 10712]
MNLRSSWVAETGQTREDTRLNQVGATTMINPVQVRSGILPGSYDGKWRLSGFWMDKASAMTATVSEGRAVIQGDISQGVYPVALPASEQVTFAAGDAQYGRIDLVVLKIYDNLYDGSTRNEAKVEIIRGVPGQAPQAPVAPPRSLPLYEVTVPAGASAGNGGIPWNTALKDLRTPVVALGGILPVEGPVLPGAHPGQYQDTANNQLQRWDGGQWVAYPEAIGGIIPSSASTLTASYTGQYRDTPGGQLQRWNGSAWTPAVPGPYFVDNGDFGDTASTAYTPTLGGRATNPLTVNFVAPPSKAVAVSFGCKLRSGSPDHYAYMALKLTQGATVVNDLDDDYATIAASQHMVSVSTTRRYSNLTPGATYTLTAHFRVIANTLGLKGGFDNTYIKVDPLP